MPVNFLAPNNLSQTPVESSSAGTADSAEVEPRKGFSKILSQRTQDRDAADGAQLPPAVAEGVPVFEVAGGLLPGLDGATHDVSRQLTGVATELVESASEGMDAAPLALGVASEQLQEGPAASTGVHAYSLGSADINLAAEQNAAGLVQANGKNLPSLVSVTDSSVVRATQQGVLQGDTKVSGVLSTKSITDTSAGSLQSAAQALTGAAPGATTQLENLDVQTLNARPTTDSVGVAIGVAADSGKSAIVSGSDVARQSSLLIEQPVNSRNWEEGFGDRILWLVNNRNPVAELRLNPPHLGAIEVRIAVQGDQAQVAFQIPGGAARDAVETALPRLREMFAEAGMNLTDVGVSDHPSHQGSDADAESDADPSGAEPPASESVSESGPAGVTAIHNTGQLDLFV